MFEASKITYSILVKQCYVKLNVSWNEIIFVHGVTRRKN